MRLKLAFEVVRKAAKRVASRQGASRRGRTGGERGGKSVRAGKAGVRGERGSANGSGAGAAEIGADAAADGTGGRLLEAAGEVFAEMGFREATVRSICSRAGANVAAVSYHFGDKSGLYRAVMEHAGREVEARYPVVFARSGDARADLERFVRAFVMRALAEDTPAWHWKMMSREMIEPTGALDETVARVIRPTFEFLSGLVAAAVGLGAERADGMGRGIGRRMGRDDEDVLRPVAFAIVSQPLMHRYCRAVVERLHPGIRDEAVSRRADEIVMTTMAMVDGVRARLAERRVGNGGRGRAR